MKQQITFKDARRNSLQQNHEYRAYVGKKMVGYVDIVHGGSIGGSVDWDRYPEVATLAVEHHKKLGRPFKE
jgi:hypothetical protein